MSKNRIFLSLSQRSGFEERYIQEALATHWITTGGPHVDAFEQTLENYLGNEAHVGALSSGTAAIHLGLILLGVQAGEE